MLDLVRHDFPRHLQASREISEGSKATEKSLSVLCNEYFFTLRLLDTQKG